MEIISDLGNALVVRSCNIILLAMSCSRSQTCKYKEGGDWAKRWVDNQVYILKVKCPLVGHYCLH